ncbi:MAG: metallophosphoesterase [Paludibacter sp.]|nr:metallophosphoesterase [Paludibacter sp.]
MKQYGIILMMMTVSLFSVKSADLIDVNFTRDSTFWINKFPGLAWNTAKTDFLVGGLDNHNIEGYIFKGAFGKFNPGPGVYAQPIDSEDFCKEYIWAFRVSNTGNNYITLPEVSSAGRLTIHCKSGNSSESAVFYIEQFTDGKWERIRTMVAPAHGNKDYDVVLRQNINLNRPATLRIYGASKNVHVYTIKLEAYDPQLAKDKPLRLIILPDTQHYVRDNPHIFQSQTAWIANNADSISFVIHVGDITNANNTTQWPVAVSALSLMDGNVPYTFTPGNHDMGGNNAQSRNTTLMNQYLPYSKYSLLPNFGGAYQVGQMDNTWHKFSTHDGYHFIILSLEFAPRNAVLAWAGEMIKAFPSHNIIINTHAYMYSDEKRHSDLYEHKWTPSTYGLYAESDGDANDGEQMWDKLVKLYPNILMVVSGHVLNDGTGTLVSDGDHGNKVYQMLANYQGGVIGSENGGNGFLRIIDIDTENAKMYVRTYSPLLDEYKTEEDQEFTFENLNLIQNTEISSWQAAPVNKFEYSVSGNVFKIHSSLGDNVSVNVLDTVGRVVYSQRNPGNRIVLPNQKACYVVHVNTGKGVYTKKVIVK